MLEPLTDSGGRLVSYPPVHKDGPVALSDRFTEFTRRLEELRSFL